MRGDTESKATAQSYRPELPRERGGWRHTPPPGPLHPVTPSPRHPVSLLLFVKKEDKRSPRLSFTFCKKENKGERRYLRGVRRYGGRSYCPELLPRATAQSYREEVVWRYTHPRPGRCTPSPRHPVTPSLFYFL